jgi:hypothetical protein
MSVNADRMSGVPVLTGLRVGAVLAVGVVILAVVGLTPSFSWIPEIPLLLTATLIPLLGFGFAGYSSALTTHRAWDGMVAGAVAGVLSGASGGLAYVAFGKPMLNLIVVPLLGVVGGAVVGAIAARYALRRIGASS